MKNENEKHWRWVLKCVSQLGGAVWIRGPEGHLRYVNPHAETLLGKPARDLVGKPCHQVFASQDSQGHPFCGPSCPLLRMARRGAEIDPVDLKLECTMRETRWVRVVVLPFTGEDHQDPYLVHCAWCIDSEHRILSLSRLIADRSGALSASAVEDLAVGGLPSAITPARTIDLTQREREILDLLTEDRNLYDVAMTLNVSYVTVRNHVQHILSKLGVHSILEAANVYLWMNAEQGAKERSPER